MAYFGQNKLNENKIEYTILKKTLWNNHKFDIAKTNTIWRLDMQMGLQLKDTHTV